MELAGLIVRTLPGHLKKVESNLLSIPGIEVHHIEPDGRMIVTLEKDTQRAFSNSITLLQNLKHTLSVSLVYQHSEESEDSSCPDANPIPAQRPIKRESDSTPLYAQCSPEQEK